MLIVRRSRSIRTKQKTLSMRIQLACAGLVFAAASASSVESEAARSHVKARVWRPSHPDFVFPETVDPGLAHLQDRDDFGIGFAGGGFRGLAIAHGAFRALHKAGITDRARYMTVSSGSVWFGIPLYYQDRDDLYTFLGETVPPEDLTREVATGQGAAGSAITRLTYPIRKFPKKKKNTQEKHDSTQTSLWSTVASEDNTGVSELELAWEAMSGVAASMSLCHGSVHICDCLADAIVPDLHEMWTVAIIGSLMHQWGLVHPNAAYCHSSQLERVREQLGRFTKVIPSMDVKHNLPFLISQSAVLAVESGRHVEAGNPLVAYPFENTLLYTGVPNAYSEEYLADTPREKFKALGDILVEPHGWPSRALEQVSDNATSEVAIHRDLALINVGGLAEWGGPATCYMEDWQIRPFMVDLVNKDFTKCIVPLGQKIVPGASFWSPLDVNRRGVPVTHDLPIADAGVYDDIGHIPLLRRGVKKMVLYDSSAVRDNSTGTLKANLEEMVYVKAAFGQPGEALPGLPPNPPGSPNYAMAENYMTVFEPSEFDALWDQTQAALASGEPAVIRGTYTVVDNLHFGIKGGWQVEIVWVFTLPSNSFRSALPQETRDDIHDYFPNYVSSEPMSHLELSVMGQYSSHLTEQRVVQEVLAMLGDSPQKLFV